MTELELRLEAVARTLDADAPAFDPGALPRPSRRLLVLAVAAALAGVAAVPPAISALQDLFRVDSMPELGPVAPDVAPAFLGRRVPLDVAEAHVPFRLRLLPSLGRPDEAYMRDDVVGAMATVVYSGGLRLTQWRASDLQAGVAVVPVRGTAEEVAIDPLRALWIAGLARGTFTLVGADQAIHRELFEVAPGALLWEDEGVALLLQGAGTLENARRLAAEAG